MKKMIKQTSVKYINILGLIIYFFLFLFVSRIFYEEIVLTWKLETKLLIGYGFMHENIFNALLILSIPCSIVWMLVFLTTNIYIYYKKKSIQKKWWLLFFTYMITLLYLLVPYEWKFWFILGIKGF